MLHTLPSLANLLKQLQQVPYLASKNLYRTASHFLHMDAHKVEQFCHALLAAQQSLVRCTICFVWKEKNNDCTFCVHERRNQQIICVVETWPELLAIEKTGGYTGVYHVLGGVICPLDGIGPDDLTIKELITRVQQSGTQEVILATNQTPEGEATAAFIGQKLKGTHVLVSCLARGIPVGSSLEYIDRLTMYKALSERRPF